MRARSVISVISAITLLSVVTQTDLAFAALTSVSRTSTVHSVKSGTWSVSVNEMSNAIPDGSGNGLSISPATTRTTCTQSSLNKTTTAAVGTGTTNKVLTLNDVVSLSIGMSVTGDGIVSPGTNSISSINSGSGKVTLTTGPNTTPEGTVVTFISTSCVNSNDSFIYLNNTGTIDISTVTFSQVVTASGTYDMKLQSCNSGNASSAVASWTIPSSPSLPTCANGSGQINTILSTLVVGGSITNTVVSSYPIAIPAGTSIKLRVLSTFPVATSKNTVISVSINTANLRASRNTNG